MRLACVFAASFTVLFIDFAVAGDLVPRTEQLQDFEISDFQLKFANVDYTYEIIRRAGGGFIIDAYFTSGPRDLSSYDYWQPPVRGSEVKLVQAKSGLKGKYIEFAVGEPWQVWRGNENFIYQMGYLIFLPYGLVTKGEVFRFVRDTNTGEFTSKSSLFYGDDKMRIGQVLSLKMSEPVKQLPMGLFSRSMPLLDILLLPQDLQNFISVSSIRNVNHASDVLSRLYPRLLIETLDETDPSEGQYIPAFNNHGTFGSSAHPRLFLKSETTRDVLLHEVLHLLIDNARLAKWPDQTVKKRRDYIAWKSSEQRGFTKNFEVMFNLLEGLLVQEGEEVEVIVYLVEHRKGLNLSKADLSKQFNHLQQTLSVLIMKISTLFLDRGHDLSPRSSYSLAEREKLLQINLRIIQIMRRIEQIDKFVKSSDCEEFLDPSDF